MNAENADSGCFSGDSSKENCVPYSKCKVIKDSILISSCSNHIALTVAGNIKAMGKPKEVVQPELIAEAYCLPVQMVKHPFLDIPLMLPRQGNKKLPSASQKSRKFLPVYLRRHGDIYLFTSLSPSPLRSLFRILNRHAEFFQLIADQIRECP